MLSNRLRNWFMRRTGPAETSSPSSANPVTWVPPGHFYSPIADLGELAARSDQIFDLGAEVDGIDLRIPIQRERFIRIAESARRMPLPESAQAGRLYYFDNDQFGPGDASIYAGMILETMPRRVIEVGSGFSSALLVDVNSEFFQGKIDCTFIEPFPDRLRSLLTKGKHSNVRLVQSIVQLVPIETFDVLERGDILFIDSTHVTKAGSDVNFLIFSVLPRLKPGVLIHFHDIFYPFEYPREWFFNGNRSWNEAYILRAFLMNNQNYRIEFFNHCFAHFNPDLRNVMPDFWRNPGGSLWLTKISPGANI